MIYYHNFKYIQKGLLTQSFLYINIDFIMSNSKYIYEAAGVDTLFG